MARLYGENAKAVLAEYAPAADEDVMPGHGPGERPFHAYSTWKWIDAAGRRAASPYTAITIRCTGAAKGGAHSAEIEYAMGTWRRTRFAWTKTTRSPTP